MSLTLEATRPAPTVIRLPDRGALSPLRVVMIFLVAAVVGGSCLLLSAAESVELVDGALPWRADSPLRAVVQLLCLNYEFPTINAGEVKNLILAFGSGLAMLALTVAVLSRSGGEGGDAEPAEAALQLASGWWRHPSPIATAQILAVCFVLWSFVSSRWSSAPMLSAGASALLGIFYLWSLALGHGLNSRASKISGRIIVAATAAASAAAIWYYYGRNPVLAAKFPFGNPSFLATCLIPGAVLAMVGLAESVRSKDSSDAGRRILAATGFIAALALIGWAFALTRSRGPAIGLAFGVLSIAFFALRGKAKVLPLVLGVAAVAAGAWYMSENLYAASATGRAATMRFRLYSWNYAWDLFVSRPVTGHGQGGFTLHGDARTAGDILSDPLPFVARVDHAHNEWLEVLTDLGAIGGLLVLGVFLATLAGGIRAIRQRDWAERWPLIGLLSSMVGMMVAECFGVGLRVAEVPSLFYTVLGLTWAAAAGAGGESPLLQYAASTPNRRIFAGALGGILGLSSLALAQQDFEAARNAYRAVEASRRGEHEAAVDFASAALLRLSPQRVLENTYRVAEANLRASERLIQRGMDRGRRAFEGVGPDEQLQSLAAEDFERADEYNRAAGAGLKRLITASPGFIGSGALEARINLLDAQMAAVRGDTAGRDAFLKNAAAALHREQVRQPFDPRLAIEYVRLAGPELNIEPILTALARPLRHHRASEGYVSILTDLTKVPGFDEQLAAITESARGAIAANKADAVEGPSAWSAELLRIAGIAHFLGGKFDAAREQIAEACRWYEPRAGAAPMGAAACYAELADVSFFSDPLTATSAIEYAKKALTTAPYSEQGRDLQASVEQRMVHYYLAAGDESAAVELLRKTAPAEVTDDTINQELGARFRRLSESILRQKAESLSRSDGGALLNEIAEWMTRANELRPPDMASHYAMARIAMLQKNAEAMTGELLSAVELDLPPEAAREMLDAAGASGVAGPSVEALRAELDRRFPPPPESAPEEKNPQPQLAPSTPPDE